MLGMQILFGYTISVGQTVVSFSLINADTEQAIKTIVTGEVLDLTTLPTKNLNIRANTNPATVGSVVFNLNGTVKTESTAPYAYAGDYNGNYNAWTPAAGNYTLKGTPYSASGGTGTAGTSLTVTFSVSTTTTTAPTTPTACSGTGGITREYWANVSGTLISAIPLNNTPSSKSQLSTFEAPANIADNYGQRLRGYICAPVTGSYTFYIAGDDNTELWLSNSDNAANKQKIASVTGWTGSREWTKYATQRSGSVYLQQGTRYYIEALHKEATGGDNLAVGWTVPNTSSIAVIQGANLIPFTTTTAPANQAPVANAGPDKTITLPTNSVVLNGSATDADGTIASYSWSQVSGPNQANFGGTSTTCQATYEEKNGLVVVEMENLPLPSGWRKNTAASGYTGSSYIEWINAAQLSTPGIGLIETTIKITKTGKYYFHWRNKVGKGTSFTEHNDSWLKFPDASNFYAEGGRIVYPHGSGKTPNPNGAGANGWFKVFSSGTTSWSWSTNTSDHENLQIVAEFNAPGIYKVQISARSDYHLLDRFVLRHATVSTTTAQQLTNTETRCTTSTISGATVASPTVSGLVQGSYVFRLTVKDNSGAVGTDDVKVTVNGTTTVSRVAAEEQPEESTVQLAAYPNPAHDQAIVEVDLPAEMPSEIAVFDMTGRQLAAEKINAAKNYTKEINLNSLKPGVYLLKVNYGNKSVTKKIIKY